MEVLCKGAEVGGPLGDPKALELFKTSQDRGGGRGGAGGGALRAAGGGGGQSYGRESMQTSSPPKLSLSLPPSLPRSLSLSVCVYHTLSSLQW